MPVMEFEASKEISPCIFSFRPSKVPLEHRAVSCHSSIVPCGLDFLRGRFTGLDEEQVSRDEKQRDDDCRIRNAHDDRVANVRLRHHAFQNIAT